MAPQRDPRNKHKHPQPQSRNLFRNFIGFVLVLILFSSILALYDSSFEKVKIIGINELAQLIKDHKVAEVTVVENSNLAITLNDEQKTKLASQKESTESLPSLLATYGVTSDNLQQTAIHVKGPSGWKFFLFQVLPIALPILFIVLFLFVMMRQVQGVNNRALGFGQTRTQSFDPEKQKKQTTFQDVAGSKESKEELEEVVDFLKHPKKFLALGARIPRGVLLMGPPGTGKTLLARAVAGEASVPFFHISGSEFVEMFVGVGASRVRDFFKRAKKAAPAILFIDEIDAVGRQRGTGLGGSHDEREQTLNQILTEMDGFEEDTGVIVIAATNRPDVLDPALLRPGRFDRRVILDLPDIAEREEILQVHARNKIFTADIEMKTIAQRTTGFSGADLMNLLNEAAIFAARNNRKKIAMEDCLEAIDKVLLGPQRKSKKVSDREKEITAYHEGGHALMAYMLPDSDPVHKVSIIPRGSAGGYTLKLPDEDRQLHSKKGMLADIAVALGGHAAEQMQFGDVTTGPSSDLAKATKMARGIVMYYGMSDELGPRTFGASSEMVFLGREIHEQRDYSEDTAKKIDSAIAEIINTQYTIVKRILSENRDKLQKIAEKLIAVETLEREAFEELLRDEDTQVSAPHDEEGAIGTVAPQAV